MASQAFVALRATIELGATLQGAHKIGKAICVEQEFQTTKFKKQTTDVCSG